MRDESEIDGVDAGGPLTGAYRLIRRVAPPESPFEGTLAKLGRAADAAHDPAAPPAPPVVALDEQRAGMPAEAVSRDLTPADDEAVVVLVDAPLLQNWAGWTSGTQQHVVGPLDLARRAGGHDVVVPWCVERVDAFMSRRDAASSPLAGGEVVTIAVSVLRGTAEVWQAIMSTPHGTPDAQQGPAGSWWLTDAGRPVFVHAVGDEGRCVEVGARHVIELLSSECDDRTLVRLLDKAAALCDKPRQLARVIDDWEGQFFAATAPRPLATSVFPAALVRELDVPSLRPGVDAAPSAARGRLRDVIAQHIDADLADMVAVRVGETLKGVRERLGRGHRMPWVAAGAVAALIVVGGVLWPTAEADETAAAEARGASETSTPSSSDRAPANDAPASTEPAADALASEAPAPEAPAPEAPAPGAPVPEAPSPEPPDVPGNELVVEAGRLLDSLAVCRATSDEAECLGDITETPGLTPPPGAVDLAAAKRVITLVDDYGGAGLVQVSGADPLVTAQLVVIVRREDKWLLRDVYDVAKQPVG